MTMRERMVQAAIKELNRQEREHKGLQDLNDVVDAILCEMETPSDEVLDASDCECGNSSDYLDFRRNDFCAMIRAIREGK